MAIENDGEVVEFLKKEENKEFLSKNGFEVEKKVEVPAAIKDEDVTKYLAAKPELSKQLGETAVNDFLKTKLGVDVTEEIKGQKFILGNEVEGFKKAVVNKLLSGIQGGDLLEGKIDYSKIEFKEGKIEGFDEQLITLKENYKFLFVPGGTNPDTPPGPKQKTPATDEEKIKAEIEQLEKKGNSQEIRARIMILNQNLENLNKK